MQRTITFCKLFISVFCCLISNIGFGQDLNLINSKIDSVEKLQFATQKEVSRLGQVLTKLNQEKLVIERTNKYKEGVTIHCKVPTKVYQKRGTWSEILDTIPKGHTLLAYDYENNYYLVEYDTLLGYVFTLDVETDEYRTKRIQKENMKKEQLNAQKRELAENRAERRALLIKKYGTEHGDKISKGQIWLGMTKEMVEDSWGKPSEVNRSVGSWGVKEQWVYYNSYLYIRNGILTSWQD